MNLQESYKTDDLIKLNSGQVIWVQDVYPTFLNGKVISPVKSNESQMGFGGFPKVESYQIKHILNDSDIDELKSEIEAFIQNIPKHASYYMNDSNSDEFKAGFMEHCKYRLRLDHEVEILYRRGTVERDAYIFGVETAKKYFQQEF